MKTVTNNIKNLVVALVIIFSVNQATAQVKNITPEFSSLAYASGSKEVSTKSKVVLVWNTAATENAVQFDIERSFDMNNFTAVAIVTEAFTESNDAATFTFNDASDNLTGNNMAYYRIRQVNQDGSSTISATKVVSLKM